MGAGCGGTEQARPSTTAPAAQTSSLPVVGCDAIIGGARYSGTENGNRVVLDTISVPSEYIQAGASPSDGKPWASFAEIGLVVRTDQPPVPKAWRERAAISWDEAKPVHSLQIASCPSYGLAWNAYSGGIHLDARTACVPLLFRVGERTETVRFGLGKRCADPP